MKKIGKLQINPEKLMKNEELMKICGGYDGPCTCYCWDMESDEDYGYLLCETGLCNSCCIYAFGMNATGMCG